MDVFCDLVDRIDPVVWPNFGVNYDPSNTLVAGEDPIELLRRIKHRVVTLQSNKCLRKHIRSLISSKQPLKPFQRRIPEDLLHLVEPMSSVAVIAHDIEHLKIIRHGFDF